MRMVLETIEESGGERYGVVTRVARQRGIGMQTLRAWMAQAEIDGASAPGSRPTSGRS